MLGVSSFWRILNISDSGNETMSAVAAGVVVQRASRSAIDDPGPP
jgi:hypothetical protein